MSFSEVIIGFLFVEFKHKLVVSLEVLNTFRYEL